MSPSDLSSPPSSEPAVDAMALRACEAILLPLARLAVGKGVRYAQIDELLRRGMVDAAVEAHADARPQRAVSRISAATGLHRREVTRLLHTGAPESVKRAPATQLLTRWLTDPALQRDGKPITTLPRQGPAPSFEDLALSVTRDVHPRTLLEELLRLGSVSVDEAADTVVLERERIVPSRGEPRLYALLGSNVGDHLSAAVENVTRNDDAAKHLEQAVFADGLSAEALEQLRPLIAEHWRNLLQGVVPVIQRIIDEDGRGEQPGSHRLRIGMYTYAAPIGHEAATNPTSSVGALPPSAGVDDEALSNDAAGETPAQQSRRSE